MELKQKEEINEKWQADKNTELKKFVNGFKYAGTGIFNALKKERNMKVHFVAMIVVIIMGFIFRIEPIEWIVCIILFAGVIGGEMFNTAIETVVDMVMPYKDERAKLAKDVSAGAVLVWAICSAIIGGIIFLPKIFGI